MDKQALMAKWNYFQMVHGVTLKLIAAFDDADLDYRPTRGVRTVRELIAHIYGMASTFPAGIRAGKFTPEIENPAIPETPAGAAEAARLTSIAKCVEFAKKSFDGATALAESLTDADLAKPIEATYGTFPTWQYFSFLYDEHWHHRGQLYVYGRLLGRKLPDAYSYDN